MRQHRLSNAIVTSPDSTATSTFASAIIATCSSSSNAYLAKSTITVATIGSCTGSGSGFASESGHLSVWRRVMHSYRLERPRQVVLMRLPYGLASFSRRRFAERVCGVRAHRSQ